MAFPAMTNNSPVAGQIAWGAFSIQYQGVSYGISAGNTSQRWVWWRFNGGSPIIEAGATVPTNLTDDDLVLFANKNGVGLRVQSTSFVDGELLVDGSIFANALSTNLINSTHIVTAGLDAGVIKFGLMSGDRIAANTITAEKLTVGALGDNLVKNGRFTDFTTVAGVGYYNNNKPNNWTKNEGAFGGGTNVWTNHPGGSALIVLRNSTGYGNLVSDKFEVTPGDKIAISCLAGYSGAIPGFYFRISWFDASDAGAGSNDVLSNDPLTGFYGDAARKVVAGAFTVPAGAVKARIEIFNFSNTGTDSFLQINDVKAQRVIISAMIGDGQITAPKILAGEINSAHIVTLGLDAAVIKFGTMSGDRITANTINSAHIVTTGLDAATIKFGVMNGERIEAGTIKSDRLDTTILTAGFTISGKIQVGTHTWTPNEGFIIPDVVLLPGLAGGTAEFTGNMTANQLTVQKDFNLLGNTNKIAGTLTLSNGVTRPTAAPSVYQSWNLVGKHDMGFGAIHYGLCENLTDAAYLLSAESFYGGAIVQMSKADGSNWVPAAVGSQYDPGLGYNYQTWLNNFYPVGGICTFGSFYYVLGQDSTRSNGWYLYKINTNFTKNAEVFIGSSNSFVGRPSVGENGTNIIIGMAVSPNTLRVISYNTSLVQQPVVNWTTFPNINNSNISDIRCANYDFGTLKYVIAIEGNRNFTTDTVGNREGDVYSFAPANGHTVRGLWWDGTRFYSYGTDGSLYTHGTNTQARSVTASHTWYDGDGGGTGTHETEETTSPATFAQGARTFLNVVTGDPPDSGTSDVRPDKANRVGVYVGIAAGSRRFQGYLGLDNQNKAIRTTRIDPVNTGSATPPGTNGFSGAANSPGILKSFGASGVQGFILNGDGSGQWGVQSVTALGVTKFGAAGSSISQITRGTVSLTSNGSAQVTWNHGGSTIPDTVIVTSRSTAYEVRYTGNSATTLTVNTLARSNGASAPSVAVIFDWIAIW